MGLKHFCLKHLKQRPSLGWRVISWVPLFTGVSLFKTQDTYRLWGSLPSDPCLALSLYPYQMLACSTSSARSFVAFFSSKPEMWRDFRNHWMLQWSLSRQLPLDRWIPSTHLENTVATLHTSPSSPFPPHIRQSPLLWWLTLQEQTSSHCLVVRKSWLSSGDI